MRRRQPLADGGQGLHRPPVVEPDAGHDADALRLDEDLALVVGGRADRLAEEVVGAPEPRAVPAVGVDRRDHLLGARPQAPGLGRVALVLRDRRQLVRGQHEQAGDEDRLGDPAVAVLGRLERLAGRVGEAVQVEAVVPVGAPDQRQAVRAEALERVVDRAPEVVGERSLAAGLVVVRDRLVEDREVAGLLEVGRDGEHEPGRVVVEARPDRIVAALGQRLVLVVGAAGRQLRRGDVEDPLAGPLRDHVDEAEQVLVRVAEAHAAPDPGLEQRGRARQVERDHALVGVPDVDHPVEVLVAGLDLERPEQLVPDRAQRRRRRPRPRPDRGSGR